MPSNRVLKPIGSSAQAEVIFLGGYNGTGAVVTNNTPVCWDAVASDGKTFVLATTTGFRNYRLFAGILTETCNTADYTGAIQCYGPVNASTWSATTALIPGCSLILSGGKTYLDYGTEGQLAGQMADCAVALETNSSGGTATKKIFVRAM